MTKSFAFLATAAAGIVALSAPAAAQGIYMGRDGRAHAQVIVAPDGRAFPVAPTFCTPGFGPCPVVLGPPAGPYSPPGPLGPPPAAYAPVEAPLPLGWVFTRYTVCPEPRVCPVVTVSVAADGLNVRAAPDGPPVLSLVNGTPLAVLTRQGQWTLVAAACDLVPTGAWSWTAGVPLSRCWIY
jgi:hypothetical protein